MTDSYAVISTDARFPEIVFHFKELLTLRVHPHQYMFQIMEVCPYAKGNLMLFNYAVAKHFDVYVAGNLFTDKLVVYDLDNMTVGWIEYDCKSCVLVRDEQTGKLYEAGSYRMSSDAMWDESMCRDDGVKFHAEHATGTDDLCSRNKSEKKDVHTGLLWGTITKLLAIIGALMCYAILVSLLFIFINFCPPTRWVNMTSQKIKR
uniref:Peptidase A1 domain-containing protein n=1 Tax=Leersia perrieri TaxID=77586 RepID=A0A0D9WDK4_9ORYZ